MGVSNAWPRPPPSTGPLFPPPPPEGKGPHPAPDERLHDLQQKAPGFGAPKAPEPGQQDGQQDPGRVVVRPGGPREAAVPRPGLPGGGFKGPGGVIGGLGGGLRGFWGVLGVILDVEDMGAQEKQQYHNLAFQVGGYGGPGRVLRGYRGSCGGYWGS